MALALALVSPLWQPTRPTPAAGGVRLLARSTAPAAAQPATPARPRPQEATGADPLLAPGLRHVLELLLLEAGEAGEASDPSVLKQRLAGLVDTQFPASLSARALALAGRYVDYRWALAQLSPVRDPGDAQALRAGLQARDALRRQFFDAAEYAALFASEDELDHYALARLQAALEPDAQRRILALEAAEALLSEEKRAEHSATGAHLEAAAQTAALEAQQADAATRHAARSARFGDAAAQALDALDHEERDWQQRLDQYRQAQAQAGGDGAWLQQWRLQRFSPEEQLRVDAALALRQQGPGDSLSAAGP